MKHPKRRRKALGRGLVVAVLLVLCQFSVLGQEGAEESIEEAAQLLIRGDFEGAFESFEEISRTTGNTCGECLVGMATASRQLGRYKEAINLAERALKLETDAKTAAFNELGLALFSQATAKKWKQRKLQRLLERSEEAFRSALVESGGAANTVRRSLAEVLYRRYLYGTPAKILPEALELLQEYVDRESSEDTQVSFLLRYLKCSTGQLAGEELLREIRPVPLGGDIEAPEKIYGPQPHYTDKARKERTNGTVLVTVLVDDAGYVLDVKVLKSLSEDLDHMTVAAIKRWRFKPATLQGSPVSVKFLVTTKFGIQ